MYIMYTCFYSVSLSLSVCLCLSLPVVNTFFFLVYNCFVFSCFCCFFAWGLDVKKYCAYSITLVNKKKNCSFVLSLRLSLSLSVSHSLSFSLSPCLSQLPLPPPPPQPTPNHFLLSELLNKMLMSNIFLEQTHLIGSVRKRPTEASKLVVPIRLGLS